MRKRVLHYAILSVFAAALLGLLGPSAGKILRYSKRCIGYSYQLDPEEGYLLLQAMELRAGRNFYRPLDSYPFVAGTYPPLYQALNAGALLFVKPGLAPGRVISLLSALALALICGWLIFAQTRNPFLALCCPLLFFVSYEMTHWIGFARVDLLAIALSAAGLVMLFGARRTIPRQYLAGFCFLLAGYTKQMQLAAPVAATLYFCFADFKTARRLAAVWIGGGALIFILFNLLTQGQFFTHTVTYNANEFDWGQLRGWLNHLDLFHRYEILAGVAAGFGFAACAIIDRSNKPSTPAPENAESPADSPDKLAEAPKRTAPVERCWGFFVFYALLNLLYIVGIAKIGAAANYILEPLFAWALLIGVSAGRLADARTERRAWAAGRYALFLAVCALLVVHAWLTLNDPDLRFCRRRENTLQENIALHEKETPLQYEMLHRNKVLQWEKKVAFGLEHDFVQAERMVEMIIGENQPVYCEWPIVFIQSGRSTQYYFQPFIMSRLAREDKWDQTHFVTDLQERHFKYLLLSVDVFDPRRGPDAYTTYTAEMVRAIRENYRPLQPTPRAGLFHYFYYVRKTGGATAPLLVRAGAGR